MNKKRLIYCLKCPFTNEVHYVGKTTNGMLRPLSHLQKSHSDKIKEWVNNLRELGHKPNIEILENVSKVDNIDDREFYYIQKHINKGCSLLNINCITPISISTDLQFKIENECSNIEHVSFFIKKRRLQTGLTQTEFSEKIGIALTVVRKIEQGKSNINLDSLLNILKMFGATIDIKKLK